MNKTILDQVLSEQADNKAAEGQEMSDCLTTAKQCEHFEQMVLSSLLTLEEYPNNTVTAMRVLLAYALHIGIAYAAAEREVQQLEELT